MSDVKIRHMVLLISKIAGLCGQNRFYVIERYAVIPPSETTLLGFTSIGILSAWVLNVYGPPSVLEKCLALSACW